MNNFKFNQNRQIQIQIEPVKEVQEIMQEYENIIQKLQYLLNNKNNYYYSIQEIIKKLEQNKKSIIYNLQTKDKNNEILKEKLTKKENQLHSKCNDIDSLNCQLKDLKSKFELKEKNIEELKDKLKVNQKDIESLKKNIQSKENDIKGLKDDLNLKDKELEKVKNKLKEKEKETELLAPNLKLQEKKVNDSKNTIQLMEKKIGELSNDLNLSQNEVKSLNDNLKLSEKKLVKLEEQYQIKEKSIEKLNNSLKLKEQELQNLNINLKEREDEILKLNGNLGTTQKKLYELNKNLQSKINEIVSLKDQLKIKENEKNELNNEKKNLSKNLSDKENKLKSLQNELTEKDKKINDLINNIGDITTMNKKLKTMEKEKEQSEEEKKHLKEKNEILLRNISTDKKYLEEDLKKFYDVVIEIDSINTLTKTGWKINYNEQREETYNEVIQKETLKIGVLGLNNVGKSFILGKLSGFPVPTGYSVETKGISIKYTKGEETCDSSICLLDSAGIETPLLIDEIKDNEEQTNENDKKNEVDKNISFMDKLEEIAKDKGQTERFIEELIISLSDMLILVVGKLTRREQNFISRIKNIVQEKENNQFKSIIIIHNLAHYNELGEVDRHINEVLKKSATFNLLEKEVIGIEKYKDRIFYTEKDGTNHLIMAREGSNAGNEYNDLAIKLIKNKYNDCQNRKKIDIPQKIIELFSKMSKDIVEDIVEIKNLHISEDKKIITVSEINKSSIKKSNEFKLQKSYIDEMGKYNSISNKYTPKCSYYAFKKSKKYFLLIRVEIPGKIENLTASFFKYGKKNTIEIKGIKTKDDFPEIKSKNIYQIGDNRNYDEIRYLLELQNEIELNRETPVEKTQTYEFEFNTNNIDSSNNNKGDEESEDDSEEKEMETANGKREENKIIASGVYVLKFELTETSWKNISKKYKKINQ